MNSTPKSRGRPKKLNPSKVLQVAMFQYWEHGACEVSINDICKIAQVSKPSIYREFGSDDGLKAAALKTYNAIAIHPFLGLFKTGFPLVKVLADIRLFLMQDRDALGIPKGCLFVAMRAQHIKLGPKTITILDELRGHFLKTLIKWIENSKKAGEFRQDIPTEVAAHQIDALHAGTMRMQMEGASANEVDRFIKYGLAAISGEPRALSL